MVGVPGGGRRETKVWVAGMKPLDLRWVGSEDPCNVAHQHAFFSDRLGKVSFELECPAAHRSLAQCAVDEQCGAGERAGSFRDPGTAGGHPSARRPFEFRACTSPSERCEPHACVMCVHSSFLNRDESVF